MKIISHTRRMYIAAWLLAALLLLGANLIKLSQLTLQPMVGSSATVNALRLKLHQFDALAAEFNMDTEVRRDQPVSLARLPQAAAPLKPPIPAIPADEPGPSEPPQLPRLSGILQVADNQGRWRYSAAMDGNVYFEKDRVQGFFIEEISSRGIVLSRGKQRWLIPAPEVYFSVDKGP
jgi:hypothetical protein